ncbi:MAG: serine/threonine-protein kinase [Solirubrobacterales bacterium]
MAEGEMDLSGLGRTFRVEQELGRGGMGVVYRAEQLGLGRMVALKVITPTLASDKEFRARFESESRVAASIESPNVVTIYEAGDADGTLYCAMQLIDGIDLGVLIDQEDRIGPERAVAILTEVAAGLDAAHARGLVHRDVKPGNVLVGSRAGSETAWLTDFGLTKDMRDQSGYTRTGQWVGTVAYVAPEQIQGAQIDARSDVYALAALLHHMLAGQAPFARDSDVATMWAHMNDQPPTLTELVPDVTPELDAVVARGMAKSPDDRPPSAGDLARAAATAIGHRAPTTPERSVAAGAAAAPGAATIHSPCPDQAPATAAAAQPAATAAPATAATAPIAHPSGAVTQPLPGGGSQGRGWLIAASVLGAIVLLGGGIAAGALILGGGDDGPGTEQQANDSSGDRSSGDDASQDGPSGSGARDDGSAPTVENTESVDLAGVTVDVPSDAGWNLSAEKSSNGGQLFTRTLTGPQGILIRLVRTPGEPAQPPSESVVSEDRIESAIGDVILFVVEGFPTDECESRRCDDYVINPTGNGGLAVLANGSGADASTQVAADIAMSTR